MLDDSREEWLGLRYNNIGLRPATTLWRRLASIEDAVWALPDVSYFVLGLLLPLAPCDCLFFPEQRQAIFRVAREHTAAKDVLSSQFAPPPKSQGAWSARSPLKTRRPRETQGLCLARTRLPLEAGQDHKAPAEGGGEEQG